MKFGKAQLKVIGCLGLLRRLELDATGHRAPDFGDSELTRLLLNWQRLEDFAWRIPCGLSAAALVAAAEQHPPLHRLALYHSFTMQVFNADEAATPLFPLLEHLSIQAFDDVQERLAGLGQTNE
jgi:hypothetical protein